jgi:acetyl esterase/lipase
MVGVLVSPFLLSSTDGPQPPREHVYREVGGTPLRAYVFTPAGHPDHEPVPAILLFHGGGWVVGSADWTFETARRFASLGVVAISVEYRLSKGDVTPVEALSDTCAAFRWARSRAASLNIDPKRVVGYGVSAGGQLVAAAATAGCGAGDGQAASKPDLLLLWSPALDMAADPWFRKLVARRGSPAYYSPAERAGASTPPTSIIQGAKDTVTPLAGAKRYCDRVTRAGGVCELHVYEGVGHLLTRNLADQSDNFDPDPVARADAIERHASFLKARGFLPGAKR